MLTSFGEFIAQVNYELAQFLPLDICTYLGGIIIVMLVLSAWRIVS